MLPRAVFSEGDAARPITASQPPGAHARLASITGQGGKAALSPPQVCAAKPRGLQAPPATAAGLRGGKSPSPGVCGVTPVPGSISKSIGWLALGGLTLIRGHPAERLGKNIEQKSLPLVRRLLD